MTRPGGGTGRRLARLPITILRLPRQWWVRQSLRARLTLLATALFSAAVITGALLLLYVQRSALTRVLDQSANRTAEQTARLLNGNELPNPLPPTFGGITAVQVVDRNDRVLTASPGADHGVSLVTAQQLAAVRDGDRPTVTSPTSQAQLRIVGRKLRSRTILVATDITRVDDSLRILTRAALIGAPLAVLLMAFASYGVVALTLRSVAALRHGAADITAAGLAEQRLPVPDAKDEIHRLAITLNAMLDRIDSATSRQRTFVGDAAHELRSPLASLRVQLEVAERLGPEDWPELIKDVLTDVDRLDRLVEDLLTLARLDESGTMTHREPVELGALVAEVTRGYQHARVPVVATTRSATVAGDPEALRRVIINLVDNAVRYATAEVRVEVVPGPKADRRVVRLIVTDDGPGIPEREREKVFDRFYRVQESRSRNTGGTGLGLPIVRDIVRNHGGRVRLTARDDAQPGLRAVVVLPMA